MVDLSDHLLCSFGTLQRGICEVLAVLLEWLGYLIAYDSIARTITACPVVVNMNAHVHVVFGLSQSDSMLLLYARLHYLYIFVLRGTALSTGGVRPSR